MQGIAQTATHATTTTGGKCCLISDNGWSADTVQFFCQYVKYQLREAKKGLVRGAQHPPILTPVCSACIMIEINIPVLLFFILFYRLVTPT